jgi:hypothetical protein
MVNRNRYYGGENVVDKAKDYTLWYIAIGAVIFVIILVVIYISIRYFRNRTTEGKVNIAITEARKKIELKAYDPVKLYNSLVEDNYKAQNNRIKAAGASSTLLSKCTPKTHPYHFANNHNTVINKYNTDRNVCAFTIELIYIYLPQCDNPVEIATCLTNLFIDKIGYNRLVSLITDPGSPDLTQGEQLIISNGKNMCCCE